MQLSTELVLEAIKLDTVCIEVVDLFARLKLTCKGLNTAVRMVMAQDRAYRAALQNVFVVPGTNIPCGADTVSDLPVPVDEASLMQIFDAGVHETLTATGAVPHANAVQVGGPYSYEINTVEDCFEHQDGASWYIAVEIRVPSEDFFEPPNVPLLDDDMADLRKVPNIFRRVLNLTELTHNYTEIIDDVVYFTPYYRMVRVFAWHTMHDVENAIADAEGWPRSESFSICDSNGEDYTATDNAFDLLATDDERMLPKIWFQLDHMSQYIV